MEKLKITIRKESEKCSSVQIRTLLRLWAWQMLIEVFVAFQISRFSRFPVAATFLTELKDASPQPY